MASQPFELKFTIAGIAETVAGVKQTAEAIGAIVAAAADTAKSFGLMAEAESASARIAREVAEAHASGAARIIDTNASAVQSEEAVAASLERREKIMAGVATALEAKRAVESAAVTTTEAEAKAEETATKASDTHVMGLRRLTDAELTARRAQQQFTETMQGVSGRLADAGGVLMTFGGLFGPLTSRMFSFGASLNLAGQAAASLATEGASLGAALGAVAVEIAPILIPLAALAVAFEGASLAYGVFKSSLVAGGEESAAEDRLAHFTGTAEAAREKLEQVHGLGLQVPVKLDELEKAEEKLTLFSRGALGGADSLRMVADAAVGVQQPILHVAEAVGRLEGALTSGQAPGRYAMQLQRMGIITPGVRTELENLHKEGVKGSQIWEVAQREIAKWSGQAAASANTWGGAMTILKNTWEIALGEFGKPILDNVRPLLSDLGTLLGRLVPSAQSAGQAIGNAVGRVYDLARNGEISRLLALEFEIAANTGIAKMLDLFSNAFAKIRTWAAGIWDSVTSGAANFLTKLTTPRNLPNAAGNVDPMGNYTGGGADADPENPAPAADTRSWSERALADAAAASKARDAILQLSDARRKDDSAKYSGKALDPNDEVEPYKKSKGGGGPAGRAKEIDQSSELEKHYRQELDLTKEALALGEISSAQAQAQNVGTIRAYIAGLQQLQNQLPKTGDAYRALSVKIKDAQQLLAQQSVFGNVKYQLTQLVNEWGNAATQIGNFAKQTAQTISSSIGTALTDMVLKTGNWRQTMAQAAKSIIGSLVQIGVQMGISYLLSKIFRDKSDSDAATSGAKTVASQTPAAVMTGVSSYGGAAVAAGIAIAAVLALVLGMVGGFREGGYTGDGHPSQPAGIVHAGEVVIPANVVQRIGVAPLVALAAGNFPMTRPMAGYQGGGLVGDTYSPTGAATKSAFGATSSSAPVVNFHMHQSEEAMHRAMRSTKGRNITVDTISGRAVDFGINT